MVVISLRHLVFIRKTIKTQLPIAVMCCLTEFLCSSTFLFTSLVGAVSAYFLRNYMQGGKFTKYTNETGKVFIVTGSNTGIGKETVRELAKRGGKVYMACRDIRKAEEARNEIVSETGNQNVFCRELDLASFASIRKFVADFEKEETKLDVLINNAGVMGCPYVLTKDGYEMQIGVNHLGHFLLTNLLLNKLKQSAPSRVVTVSSMAYRRGAINVDDLNSEKSYSRGKAYHQSKLANVLFTRELANQLKGTGVTANALHPGLVASQIGRHLIITTNFFLSILIKPLVWTLLKTTKNGAQTTLYAALDRDLDNITGKFFSDCALKEVAPAATDDKMAKWLWSTSEKWTKLSENKSL